MKSFLKKHPLAAFFILAFGISWSGILLIIFYSGTSLFRGEDVLSKGISGQLMYIWLIMLAGPAFAGLLVKRIADGKDGFRQSLSLMFNWKVSIRWYAAALLIFPALLVPIIYSFALFSSNYYPGLLIGTGIAAGLIGGFLEEIGWTGFALPKLQLKYIPFTATIILGFIHTVWHLLADYLGGISFYKGYYVLHFLLWLIALTAFRLIACWIFNHTNSLLLVQLAHASFTGIQFVFGPPAATASESVLWYSVFTAALCMVTIIIILKDKNLFFPTSDVGTVPSFFSNQYRI